MSVLKLTIGQMNVLPILSLSKLTTCQMNALLILSLEVNHWSNEPLAMPLFGRLSLGVVFVVVVVDDVLSHRPSQMAINVANPMVMLGKII